MGPDKNDCLAVVHHGLRGARRSRSSVTSSDAKRNLLFDRAGGKPGAGYSRRPRAHASTSRDRRLARVAPCLALTTHQVAFFR